MKYILTLLAFLSGLTAVAQVPQAISYQAVARDSAGNLLGNDNISLRISVRNGTAGGTILYRETHSVVTNELGLFTINLGLGTVVSGTFAGIIWASASALFLQVEIDVTGGSSYVNMGSQQLLSVPYAIHAASSGGSWSLTGNGTTTASNFIGTTDNVSLNFRVNNQKAGFVGNSLSNQTFLGYQAGNVTTGLHNTAIGYQSMLLNTSGQLNTALGSLAMRNSTMGNGNVALGYQSMFNNTNGGDNTAVGVNTLFTNTFGSSNVAVGSNAMHDNTSGLANTAVGISALYANTSGQGNTAIGNRALEDASTALYNTAVGWYALNSVGTWSANTAVGASALFANTGGDNTAIGYQALMENGFGFANVAVGYNALNNNRSGSNNTAIGNEADVSDTAIFNATAIGANAVVSISNALVLGNNADVGIGTSSPSARLHVNGTVKIGSNGTTITNIIKGTANTTNQAIGPNTTISQTYAMANVIAGSSVIVTTGSPLNAGLVLAYWRVQMPGVIEVAYRNTTGLSVTLSGGIPLYITVIQ